MSRFRLGAFLEASPDVDKRGLRVLVVEDEKLIRWAVGEALSFNGHTVIEAVDAASARHVLEQSDERPDVVLLDYRLPDSDDFQLLEDVKRLSPASRVVMITAYADPALTAAAIGHGAQKVLDKPFDLGVLESVVREATAE